MLCPGPQGCQSSGTQKALAPFEDRAVLPTLAWDSAPWRNRAFLALSRRKTLIPVIPNFVSWPLIITALPRMHKISQENISFFLSSYLLDTEVQTCPKWIDIIFYLQAAILTDPSFFPPQLPGASHLCIEHLINKVTNVFLNKSFWFIFWVPCKGRISNLQTVLSDSRSVVSDSLQPHGVLWARILVWVASPFSRGSSQPRDGTQVSHIAGRFFTSWATKEAQEYWSGYPIPSPADHPDPGIEPGSPPLQVDSLPTELSGKPGLLA